MLKMWYNIRVTQSNNANSYGNNTLVKGVPLFPHTHENWREIV